LHSVGITSFFDLGMYLANRPIYLNVLFVFSSIWVTWYKQINVLIY